MVTWRLDSDKCHLQPKNRTSAADRLRTRPRQIAPGEIAARGRFTRLSAGHLGNSLEPAMAAFCALLSQRLRRSNCTAELTNRLALPNGIAWIWWGVRTSFANPAKVKQRLERIRDVTAILGYYRAFTAKRARTRQSRRASINCQVITPGTPSPISLARATRERAKAPSPGIPSKFPTKR